MCETFFCAVNYLCVLPPPDYFRNLFYLEFDDRVVRREREEAVYVHFMDYIEDCECKKTMVVAIIGLSRPCHEASFEVMDPSVMLLGGLTMMRVTFRSQLGPKWSPSDFCFATHVAVEHIREWYLARVIEVARILRSVHGMWECVLLYTSHVTVSLCSSCSV